MRSFLSFFPFVAHLVSASPRRSLQDPLRETRVTSASPYEEAASPRELLKRQTTAFSSTAIPTCGYVSGNANWPVTGRPGDTCVFDTVNGLWGICASTAVLGAANCDLAAYCVDTRYCSNSGCDWQSGTYGRSGATITCTKSGADLCGVSLYWNQSNGAGFESLICTTTTGRVSGSASLSGSAGVNGYIYDSITIEAFATFTPSSSSPTSSSTFSSPTPTQTPTSKSSKSSPKTAIIVGVLVPVLVIGLLVAAMLIRRYRLNRRKENSEGVGLKGAGGMEKEKMETEAFIPQEPTELPATSKRISELEAVSGPVELPQ